MTNKRPSLGLPNLKSISVPPRSAIDTGTYKKQKLSSGLLDKNSLLSHLNKNVAR